MVCGIRRRWLRIFVVRIFVVPNLVACGLLCAAGAQAGEADAGTLKLLVRDERGKPVPCRIHLYDAENKPQRANDLPFARDHFVCPGSVELKLGAGEYHYEIERGPEFERLSGRAQVKPGRTTDVSRQLKRIANMAAKGWYGGELHIHRSPDDIELLMQAEDLHVAPVITWWNSTSRWKDRPLPKQPLVRFDGNRYYHLMAGEDERQGGALMYFNLKRPLDMTKASREYPSPLTYLNAAHRQNPDVWVDIEKIYWYDVPVWLASGKIDSIGLASNHMWRLRMYENEAWGKHRDTRRLPPPLGTAWWGQEIYYHVLDSGLRIPPSAGSASGVHPNPIGYNRVYVHNGKSFDYARWWQQLKAGRCFVTNGPLLVCRADGHLPGHVFSTAKVESRSIALKIELTSLDPISKVEVIYNGRVAATIDAAASRSQTLSATFDVDKSGWFLIRAVADVPQTFRFASTGPFYVEIGQHKRRVSRRSAKFFLDWVEERIERVKIDDPQKREEVLGFHRQAKRFWQQRVEKANAE